MALKGYRTVLFNVLAVAAPVLQGSGVDLGLEGVALSIYAGFWGAVNLYLRSVTREPLPWLKGR